MQLVPKLFVNSAFKSLFKEKKICACIFSILQMKGHKYWGEKGPILQ